MLGPSKAMHFGRQRLLHNIVNTDLKHGPVYMCKVNIADGFVAFPPAPDDTPLIAFPLTCPMGWVESPP